MQEWNLLSTTYLITQLIGVDGLTCNLVFSLPGQSLPPRPSTRYLPSAPGSSEQRGKGHMNHFIAAANCASTICESGAFCMPAKMFLVSFLQEEENFKFRHSEHQIAASPPNYFLYTPRNTLDARHVMPTH